MGIIMNTSSQLSSFTNMNSAKELARMLVESFNMSEFLKQKVPALPADDLMVRFPRGARGPARGKQGTRRSPRLPNVGDGSSKLSLLLKNQGNGNVLTEFPRGARPPARTSGEVAPKQGNASRFFPVPFGRPRNKGKYEYPHGRRERPSRDRTMQNQTWRAKKDSQWE